MDHPGIPVPDTPMGRSEHAGGAPSATSAGHRHGVAVAIPVIIGVARRPPSGSDDSDVATDSDSTDTDSITDTDTDSDSSGLQGAPTAGAPGNDRTTPTPSGVASGGAASPTTSADNATNSADATGAPTNGAAAGASRRRRHRVRFRVPSSRRHSRRHGNNRGTHGRTTSPELPVPPMLKPTPGAFAPALGKRLKRKRPGVKASHTTLPRAGHVAKEGTNAVRAVLASPFLASNRRHPTSASEVGASAGVGVAVTLSMDAARRLVLDVPDITAKPVVAAVSRIKRTIRDPGSVEVARSQSPRNGAAGATAAARLVMPSSALSAVLLGAGPDVQLRYRGRAARVLAATARRLGRVAAGVQRVLAAPWQWPVMMTRTVADADAAAGVPAGRYLSVECYASVHASMESAPLDLAHHRNVEVWLRRVHGALVVSLPGVAGAPPRCYVRQDPAVAAAAAAAPATLLPVVEAVPQPAKPFRDADVGAAAHTHNPRPPKKQRTRIKVEVRKVRTQPQQQPCVPGGGVTKQQDAPHTPDAPVCPPPRRHTAPFRFTVPSPPTPAPQHGGWTSTRSIPASDEPQEALLARAAAELRSLSWCDSRHLGVQGLTADHWRSPCPWTRLGLSPAATARDVRARYRVLALRLHPDKNRGSAIAARAFVAVVAAYKEVMQLMDV